MADSEISQEEADHNCFCVIYYPTLRALSCDVQQTCKDMGNYNTAWEIQDELVNYSYLANSPALALELDAREAMLALAEDLKTLPVEAIAPTGLKMTTAEGCRIAMSHPAWEAPRRKATFLLAALEGAIQRSENFFRPK